MSESDAEAAGSRKRRRKSCGRKTGDLAGWRAASAAGGEVAGPGGAESDYERRKRALAEKVESEARRREDAYPLRNVAGEGVRIRLVVGGEESEGVPLESVIRLGAGRSSRDLPPAYAELLACHADGKRRVWFDKILQAGSVEVRVLRYVTKWRTLIMVSWTVGPGRRPAARPRYLDTAGDCVEECCGYSGELKDAAGRSLGEVVYGWFPHSNGDRLAWFGDGGDAGAKEPASARGAEIPAGPPASKPAMRERKKRKEVPINAAAVMCRVSERTIKNWEAGASTPIGWPGRSDLQSLQAFAAKRGSVKAFRKAIRIGLGSVLHPGDMDQFADHAGKDR